MTKDQETLLQIIKGHLERNEKSGKIEFKPLFNGNISVLTLPEKRQNKYFVSVMQKGIDKYGQIIGHDE